MTWPAEKLRAQDAATCPHPMESRSAAPFGASCGGPANFCISCISCTAVLFRGDSPAPTGRVPHLESARIDSRYLSESSQHLGALRRKPGHPARRAASRPRRDPQARESRPSNSRYFSPGPQDLASTGARPSSRRECACRGFSETRRAAGITVTRPGIRRKCGNGKTRLSRRPPPRSRVRG